MEKKKTGRKMQQVIKTIKKRVLKFLPDTDTTLMLWLLSFSRLSRLYRPTRVILGTFCTCDLSSAAFPFPFAIPKNSVRNVRVDLDLSSAAVILNTVLLLIPGGFILTLKGVVTCLFFILKLTVFIIFSAV